MDFIFRLIEIIGIISFTASGAMVAIDRETDLFGVIILSGLTCFGGGLTRDIILGTSFPAFFSMHLELAICVATSLVIFIAASIFKNEYVIEEVSVNKINNILDALGIGIFAAVGTEMYIAFGPLAAIFAGTVTSVGGGLIRDVILRDVPFILNKRVYAVAVIIGASLYYVFEEYVFTGCESTGVYSTIICVTVVFAIRMCATYLGWNIPKAIKFSEMRSPSTDTEAAAEKEKIKK